MISMIMIMITVIMFMILDSTIIIGVRVLIIVGMLIICACDRNRRIMMMVGDSLVTVSLLIVMCSGVHDGGEHNSNNLCIMVITWRACS
jgi:hypothetical protein